MSQPVYKEDIYKIVGICTDVHRELRKGFNEVVYGDALKIELIDNNINYSKETKFDISYKGNLLPHKHKADFIINNKIVLEIKPVSTLTDSHVNYLGASPRGIRWKQDINFEASLGVLYPLSVPIKQTLNYLAVSKLKSILVKTA